MGVGQMIRRIWGYVVGFPGRLWLVVQLFWLQYQNRRARKAVERYAATLPEAERKQFRAKLEADMTDLELRTKLNSGREEGKKAAESAREKK